MHMYTTLLANADVLMTINKSLVLIEQRMNFYMTSIVLSILEIERSLSTFKKLSQVEYE